MAARTNLRRLAIAGSALLASLSLNQNSFAADLQEIPGNCLRLGADESLAQFYHLFEDLVADIYHRAGFCAISIPASPKRIEQMITAGTLDGDWIRVEGYAETFGQDLVEVPVPLFQIEAVLLSLAYSDFNGQPEDLAERRVGYQAGFRWIEKNLPLMGGVPVELPSGTPVKDLLKRGRFEIFATDGVRAKMIEKTFTEEDPTLRIHSWRKISFYHLVHSRHANKREALKTAFDAAIVNGEFEKIFALPGLSRADGN